MPTISEEIKFPLKCPKCGHQFEESVARLKQQTELPCPVCGHEFEHGDQVSAGDTLNSVDQISRAWDKISKN